MHTILQPSYSPFPPSAPTNSLTASLFLLPQFMFSPSFHPSISPITFLVLNIPHKPKWWLCMCTCVVVV